MSKGIDKTGYTLNKFFIYFLVIFCFVAIPAFILSYSVYRYYQTNEEEAVYNLKINMQYFVSEVRRNLDAEKYFCRLFHIFNKNELNNSHSNIENSIDFCKKQKRIYGNKIDFVVMTNNAEIKYNSNPEFYNYKQKDWIGAFYFFKSRTCLKSEYKTGYDFGNLDSVKKILGFQFVDVNLKSIFDEDIYALYWGDSSTVKFPAGVYTFKWGGFFAFISNDLLKDYSHLKYYIIDNTTNNNLVTGLYRLDEKDKFFFNKDNFDNKEIIDILNDSKSHLKNFIETTNYYICNQSLTKNYYIFIVSKKENTDFSLFIKGLFVFVIYFLFSFPILKYFWYTIILNKSGKASIRLKIAFLFFFATGIPLLIFSVVSHEYELHKRHSMINEAKMWSIEKLLGIEKKYQVYLKKIATDLSKFIEKWSLKIKDEGLNIKNYQPLIYKVESLNPLDYYCISSETQYLGAYNSLVKIDGPLDNMKFDLDNSIYNPNYKYPVDRLKATVRRKYNDFESIIIICKKLFSDINGKEIPAKVLTKIEILLENFLQKSFSEILFSIVEHIDNIKELGFGDRVVLAYYKMISCYKKGIYDYIFMVTWYPEDLQRAFVSDFLIKENRNPNGFKLLGYDRLLNEFTSNQYNNSLALVDLAKKAGVKPTEELEIIDYKDEKYVAVSLLDKNVDKFSFIGLYPLNNIELKINKLSFLFWLLGILSFILAIGLAQLLTKSFINPLLKLHEGALAIENRNFKYRLSIPNVDEFGEVSGIFNHMMVGLQELEIAKIIQESMFPKPEFNQGKFSVYGKSVTMIDVGGDYLDFFKVDDNNFAVLLGDVAGHGVAAAVIMAMAKATILVSGNYLHSPSAILNELHKTILSVKTSKHKKFMTFQYMLVNSETGENLYSNAGGCSPCLVRPSSKSLIELEKYEPVLGGFKNTVYSETSFEFVPGDAIVFFTDGIVECKNKKGEVLGYKKLKDFFLSCYDSNPKTYYENIYKAYLDYTGMGSEPEDDLTIIVLSYSKFDNDEPGNL